MPALTCDTSGSLCEIWGTIILSAVTTLKLLSWNVNGARAIHRTGFLDWLDQAAPDILCLQETRAEEAQLPPQLVRPPGYHGYWTHSTRKKGHSGTAILTRLEPRRMEAGIGSPEFDDEGRTLVAYFGRFVLINCYFPNGGRDQERVPYKLAFYDAFQAYCDTLRSQGHSLVICGDVNTAHQEIDLARPKQNVKSTGFLPEERAWLDRWTAAGYVDTFRHRHPERAGAYTWWLQWGQARERNIGWRLDYFFVTPDLIPFVVDAFILPDVKGSDHCPAGLTLDLPNLVEGTEAP
jgi:exodeoxyribonuclease-3